MQRMLMLALLCVVGSLACSEHTDCGSDHLCINANCRRVPAAQGRGGRAADPAQNKPDCYKDSDCRKGGKCNQGTCLYLVVPPNAARSGRAADPAQNKPDCYKDSDCQKGGKCNQGTCLYLMVPLARSGRAQQECTKASHCSQGICHDGRCVKLPSSQ